MVFGWGSSGTTAASSEKESKEEVDGAVERAPFTFSSSSGGDEYVFPDLYDEADSMLQVALLIYTVTDLRTLAKKKNTKLNTPERILTLPIELGTCLEMIEENIDVIKEAFGDNDHEMTMSALKSIQERYEKNTLPGNNSSGSAGHHWWNPFSQEENIEIQRLGSPVLVAYGDEKPMSDLVYAVGVDPLHKRITVAFRGSVTPADFLTDACISINLQPNPVNKDAEEEGQSETIGIHHGFYDYLLKVKKDGKNKYEEILEHVKSLFEESEERQKSYKLYVTGHSLGGALATLFSFHVAASALNGDNKEIPIPVTCVSVASPRVGEGSFQRAFRHLEERGLLRHLRIANDRDPVTIMPKSSGKKVWANLSPISYMAFKMMDNEFVDKETYRHTGIKLKLQPPDSKRKPQFELEYSGAAKSNAEQEKEGKESASITDVLGFHKIPNVVLHMGNAYTENLAVTKEHLKGQGATLNGLYKTLALNTAKP